MKKFKRKMIPVHSGTDTKSGEPMSSLEVLIAEKHPFCPKYFKSTIAFDFYLSLVSSCFYQFSPIHRFSQIVLNANLFRNEKRFVDDVQ